MNARPIAANKDTATISSHLQSHPNLNDHSVAGRPDSQPSLFVTDNFPENLDSLTDWVIRRDFDPSSIGKAIHKMIDVNQPIENIVAFAAIIAKAIIARRKRNQTR